MAVLPIPARSSLLAPPHVAGPRRVLPGHDESPGPWTGAPAMSSVADEGFEPPKAVPADLQSAPFGRLGNLPRQQRRPPRTGNNGSLVREHVNSTEFGEDSDLDLIPGPSLLALVPVARSARTMTRKQPCVNSGRKLIPWREHVAPLSRRSVFVAGITTVDPTHPEQEGLPDEKRRLP